MENIYQIHLEWISSIEVVKKRILEVEAHYPLENERL